MRAAALIAVALCACVVSAAHATTFHVVDDRGVPQLAEATVADIGLSTATNEAGEVEPGSEPGDTVTITRSDQSGPCGAPEGPVGPSYAVPDPEPDFVEVVVPALPTTATDPALSAQERDLLGRLNEQRAASGAPQLVGSEALAEAADGYAGALGGDPTATSDHCALWGPEVRAIDRGWPFDDVQETLGGAGSPTAALADWLAEPSDRAALLEPRFGAIGVARVGDLWVAVVSRPCGRLLGARCRMTGDTGDPALADALPTVTAPAPLARGSRADPRLRLELVERTGLSVRARVRLDPSARGRLRGWLRRGQVRRNLHAHRRRAGSFELSARVRRPGRWRLVVRFDGAPGWRDAALPARTLRFVPRRAHAALARS
jgi:uncharacterized protein YkwD